MNELVDKLRKKILVNQSQILELKGSVKQKDQENTDMTKNFLLGIIDVMDSFENKEAKMLSKYGEHEQVQKVLKNFGAIRGLISNLLLKHGVTKMEFPDRKLKIGYCKVIGTEPDLNNGDDTIITIVRDGYLKGTEVIREAEIVVVKN